MAGLPSPTPVAISRALRDLGADFLTWRKLRRFTAAQIAARAGVSRGTLRRLEAGEGGVSLENTLRIARALGMLDPIATSMDPFRTDVGRLRSEEALPQRVRYRAPRNVPRA